ncbi:hypothetical protein ABC345_21225 [Shouchella sp. 1P09AA]|uniref:hypothetical protein n=1 Tax=unclassified Shouchella TaxID=2893065 RepID=UPI0039A09A0A
MQKEMVASVSSCLLGLTSIFFCIPFVSLLIAIFGLIISKKTLKNNPEKDFIYQISYFGKILSIIGIVIGIVVILFFIALFILLRSFFPEDYVEYMLWYFT